MAAGEAHLEPTAATAKPAGAAPVPPVPAAPRPAGDDGIGREQLARLALPRRLAADADEARCGLAPRAMLKSSSTATLSERAVAADIVAARRASLAASALTRLGRAA